MSRRYRQFCFTINNYSENDIKLLADLDHHYMVYGKEVGDNGTPHLQGYCQLLQQKRLSALKKYLPRAHIEEARDKTGKLAAAYCKKGQQPHAEWTEQRDRGPNYGLNADVFESGELRKQGERTDVESMLNACKQHASDLQLLEEHGPTFVKYTRGADRARLVYARATRPRYNSNFKVIVYYGSADAGKTRKAHEIDPFVHRLHVTRDGTVWADGVDSSVQTCLLDDYYGTIPWGQFLELTDKYEYQLPIKGGFTWKYFHTLIITSNVHPREWYGKFPPELERRLTIIEVKPDDPGLGTVLPQATSETTEPEN